MQSSREASWSVTELAQLANVSPRTVRYYVSAGVLPAPQFRSKATRYHRSHLLRLLAVQRFQREAGLKLAHCQQRLNAMPTAELERFALAPPLTPEQAAALGLPPVSPDPSPERTPGPGATQGGTVQVHQASAGAVEIWQRMVLMPGLEMSLSSAASPAARAFAERLWGEVVMRRSGKG